MAPLSSILAATALLALAAGHPLSHTSPHASYPVSMTPSHSPSSRPHCTRTTTVRGSGRPTPTSLPVGGVSTHTVLPSTGRPPYKTLPGTGRPPYTTLPGTGRPSSTRPLVGTATGGSSPTGAPSSFVGTGKINVVIGSAGNHVGCLDENMNVILDPSSSSLGPVVMRDVSSYSPPPMSATVSIIGSSPSLAPTAASTTPLQSSSAASGGDVPAPSASSGGDTPALAKGVIADGVYSSYIPMVTGNSPPPPQQNSSSGDTAALAKGASLLPFAATSTVSLASPSATSATPAKTCATFTGMQAQATGTITLSSIAGECGAVNGGKFGSKQAPTLACGKTNATATKGADSAHKGFFVKAGQLGGSTTVLCDAVGGACSYATNTIGAAPAAIHDDLSNDKDAMVLTWTPLSVTTL